MNNLSLTIRLPHDLSTQLAAMAKQIGVTKTNLIRSAIHDFLLNDEVPIEVAPQCSGKKDRIVLNVNQLTYDILATVCQKHNQSINAVVTAVSLLALERSAKWLQSVEH